MGQKYTSQSSSGYNSSPPPDDGSTVAANKITWATIKSKLPDPLKTFIEAVNSQLVTALDYSATTTSVNYTTVAGDHQKPIQASGTTTISLGDATTMAAGYQVAVINTGTGIVTVGLVTATDDLDGVVNGTVKLTPGNSATFAVKSGATGYKTLSRANPYIHGADVASAATVNLDTATGDCVDVTGTTTITAITLQDGAERTVRFTGALTLTNGASLVLPGAANITTAAGDYAIFRGYASGVVRCLHFLRAATGATPAKQPTIQDFTSGSGTYTTPSGCTRIIVKMVGGGGGGGGAVGTGGTAGNNTTFGALTAGGGAAGAGAGGAGGTASGSLGTVISFPGAAGQGGATSNAGGIASQGGNGGGSSLYSGGGGGGQAQAGVGAAGATNTGGGGGGGAAASATNSAGGGGGGASIEATVTSPSATYSYGVGGTAAGGVGGSSTGGAGAAGRITVYEYYD